MLRTLYVSFYGDEGAIKLEVIVVSVKKHVYTHLKCLIGHKNYYFFFDLLIKKKNLCTISQI